MKVLLPVLLALLSVAATAQTQHIGIAGGFNSTNVTGTSSGRVPEFRTGFYGGLSYEYRTNGIWQFGADLLFQQRGYNTVLVFSLPQYPEGVQVKARHSFNYLALPLKAGVHFGKKMYGFGNVGLVPALRINSGLSWKDQSYPGGTYPAETHSPTDNRVFDLAGLAELGAGYRLTPRFDFHVCAGFQHSLMHYNLPNFLYQNNLHYGFNGGLALRYRLGK